MTNIHFFVILIPKQHLISVFFIASSNSGLPHPDNPYHGISASSFSEEINKVLLSSIEKSDVEIKPDGISLI